MRKGKVGAVSNEVMARIGGRMNQARKEAGLTVEEVCEFIGRTPNTYYKYARGEDQPKPETMELFARLVKKPVAWFYDGFEDAREYVQERMSEVAVAVKEGARPSEAVERALAEPQRVSPAIRLEIDLSAGSLRELLEEDAPHGWDALTTREKRDFCEKALERIREYQQKLERHLRSGNGANPRRREPPSD